jgi:hypothetical protein
MRKLTLLLALFAVLLACKKEDKTAPPGPNEWLVGNWSITDLEVSGNIDFAGTVIPINGEGENFAGGFQFNNDKSAAFDATCDVLLNIPGLGQQTVPYGRVGTGTWKLTNNATILEVVESTGQTTIFPIKVLTANIMIVEQDSSFNMAGFSGSINYEVTLEK